MKFTPPLKHATLIQRYKRFLADVITPEGETLTLHCPNTGAMTGCATPGDTVWYSTSENTKRKYPHTWEMTETQSGAFICVNTLRANQLVKEALINGHITDSLESDRSYQSMQHTSPRFHDKETPAVWLFLIQHLRVWNVPGLPL
mgnify:CR=1 FL=1